MKLAYIYLNYNTILLYMKESVLSLKENTLVFLLSTWLHVLTGFNDGFVTIFILDEFSNW